MYKSIVTLELNGEIIKGRGFKAESVGDCLEKTYEHYFTSEDKNYDGKIRRIDIVDSKGRIQWTVVTGTRRSGYDFVHSMKGEMTNV